MCDLGCNLKLNLIGGKDVYKRQSWCCARPSGTEPKIKFYMGVKGTSLEDAKARNEKLTEELKAVIEA